MDTGFAGDALQNNVAHRRAPHWRKSEAPLLPGCPASRKNRPSSPSSTTPPAATPVPAPTTPKISSPTSLSSRASSPPAATCSTTSSPSPPAASVADGASPGCYGTVGQSLTFDGRRRRECGRDFPVPQSADAALGRSAYFPISVSGSALRGVMRARRGR